MDFKELINSKQPVLVDFSAEWCGPCKMMAPILTAVKSDLGASVTIVKIDIDKSPNTASSYHVQSVPTLILFKEGKILWRQSGVVDKGSLAGVIRKFV